MPAFAVRRAAAQAPATYASELFGPRDRRQLTAGTLCKPASMIRGGHVQPARSLLQLTKGSVSEPSCANQKQKKQVKSA